MLNHDGRLLFLDFEGTGTDPYNDRIVEVCLFRSETVSLVTRVNPDRPIPPEATAVHGITDDDVRGAPKFHEIALDVQQLVEGAILCGYNIRRYDTIILDAELRRAGRPGIPRREDGQLDVPEIDLYRLWTDSEPRTLEGAAKRFAGVELGASAHTAEADTRCLPAVLSGMVTDLALDDDIDALCRRSVPAGEVDRDGKFLLREDGVVLFNFTQHKGRPAKEDSGLLHWICNKDFSSATKAVAFSLLEELHQERMASIATAPPAVAVDEQDDLPF